MKADLYTANVRTSGVGGLAHRTAAGFVVLTSADGDDIIALIDAKQNESDLIDQIVANVKTDGPESFMMLFTAGGELYLIAAGAATATIHSASTQLSMSPMAGQVLVHPLSAGINETAANIRLHPHAIDESAGTNLELQTGTVEADWLEVAVGGATIAAVAAPEPLMVDPEPEPEPVVIADPEPEPVVTEPEPAIIAPAAAAIVPEPAVAEPEPAIIAAAAAIVPEPAVAEPKPAPEPEPTIAIVEPEVVIAAPAPVAAEPVAAAPAPSPAPAPVPVAADPVAAAPAPAPAPVPVAADPVTAAPAPVAAPAPSPASVAGPVMVLGVACSQGHHNHPDAVYCSQCGTKMGVHHTTVLLNGPRPPLGVLVVDDGTTYSLNEDLVIGREPTSHVDVIAGTAAPMILTDDTLSLSRKHARVRLDEWAVFVEDLNSSNGTYLSRAGQTEAWTKVDPSARVALEPGDRLRVGGRIIQVELHHVR